MNSSMQYDPVRMPFACPGCGRQAVVDRTKLVVSFGDAGKVTKIVDQCTNCDWRRETDDR